MRSPPRVGEGLGEGSIPGINTPRSHLTLPNAVIESGRVKWTLLYWLTGDVFGNLRKMGEVTIPTLIIHGRKDKVIPVSEGQELYHYCAAQDKKLVLIENAGHNIRISLEHNQFFNAIQRFVGNAEQSWVV